MARKSSLNARKEIGHLQSTVLSGLCGTPSTVSSTHLPADSCLKCEMTMDDVSFIFSPWFFLHGGISERCPEAVFTEAEFMNVEFH